MGGRGDGGRVPFIYHQIKSAGVTDFVDSGMGGITDSTLNQVANETSPCHLDFCNFFIKRMHPHNTGAKIKIDSTSIILSGLFRKNGNLQTV